MRRLLILLAILVVGCVKYDVENCDCDHCVDIKIGQMIVTGFKGVEPSSEIIEAIKDYNIGGVILSDQDLSANMGERNISSPEQLRELTNSLRSLTSRRLLIAIDQEGGFVSRLKPIYGFPATVSAAYQGQGSVDEASSWASATASTLVDAGINVNFAPCVDVNVNPNNPIIGMRERSFSSNPDSVYLFARRWVEEHRKKGIITSLKHFPGHGSSLADSHLGLVDITNTWSENELIAYRRAIENGYNGIVMVGHLFNTNIDADYPASLSAKTLTGLLRNDLGFKGVIATDDMNMGAIVDNYSFKRAIILTINAGTNLIILGNNGKIYEPGLAVKCHKIIKNAVASGEIPIAKINDSYQRLQKLLQ